MNHIEKYRLWKTEVNDPELIAELDAMQSDEAMIEEAFFKELEFGTAGLRGIIGAGTGRMNIYTVAKASQGLADYLVRESDNPSVAIAYDSRLKSDDFAKVAASTLCANGVKVYIWPRLMPVPVLSYTIRELGTSAGIVITASHNPGSYNGYKVYGSDGCQITSDIAEKISAEIAGTDIFEDVKTADYENGLKNGDIVIIDDAVFENYLNMVKQQTMLFGERTNKDIAIVYSPLNGAGLEPVTRVLQECGYSNVTIVEEQKNPDGNFPTCTYPNPENRDALKLGIEYAEKIRADLVIATDPDCDRAGIAVKNKEGRYVLLSGNQIGTLLLDYICSQRIRHSKMPDSPVFLKSLVTTELAEAVAGSYGVKTKNLPIGFKYIGEQIGILEQSGKEDSFVFGFEESCGYLSGTYARDKDGVNAVFLICEMFAYYMDRGITLIDRLNDIYDRLGCCCNRVFSYVFEGAAGFIKMKSIMSGLRAEAPDLGAEISGVTDYLEGIDGLSPADILRFSIGRDSVIIRPSGTEPKIKVYVNLFSESEEKAEILCSGLKKYIDRIFTEEYK